MSHQLIWMMCVTEHPFLDRAGASLCHTLSDRMSRQDPAVWAVVQAHGDALVCRAQFNVELCINAFPHVHVQNAQAQENIFVLNCPPHDMTWCITCQFYPLLRWWLSNTCAIRYVSVVPKPSFRTFRTDYQQQEKLITQHISLQPHNELAYGALCWA